MSLELLFGGEVGVGGGLERHCRDSCCGKYSGHPRCWGNVDDWIACAVGICRISNINNYINTNCLVIVL